MCPRKPEDNDEDDAAAILRLSDEDIAHVDRLLQGELRDFWQKSAMVVAGALIRAPEALDEVPDWYFAKRLVALRALGLIESQGDLAHLRSSEVRHAPASEVPEGPVPPGKG